MSDRSQIATNCMQDALGAILLQQKAIREALVELDKAEKANELNMVKHTQRSNLVVRNQIQQARDILTAALPEEDKGEQD